MFGLIEAQALLEAGVICILFYLSLKQLIILTGLGARTELILTVFTVILFMFLSLLLNGHSVVDEIRKRVKFYINRRKLKFREIRNRRVLLRKPSIVEKKLLETNDSVEIDLKQKLPGQIIPQINKRFELYSQERLPVKSINNSYIELKDGRFIKILQIKAANFLSLSSHQRAAILSDFGRLLNRGPVKGKLKVISKRSDLNTYISKFIKRTRKEKSPTLIKLVEEIKGQLNNLSNYTALEHTYLFIFEVSSNFKDKEEAKLDALETLEIYTNKVKSTLGKRGIEVTDYSQDSDYFFTGTILYNFYNKNKVHGENFIKRRKKLFSDNSNLKEPKESIPASSLISPRGFNFTHKDVIVVDGIYTSFITVIDYPQSGIEEGFLNFFTNVGEGFDFDLIYRREFKKEIRERLQRRTLYTKTNADQMGSFSSALLKTQNIIQSNQNMFVRLEGDCEFFNFLLICSISADSYKECIEKRKWLKEHLESYNFKVVEANFNAEEVYELIEPLGVNLNRHFEKYKRNILTDGLTYFYPYTSSQINQEEGVLIGVDKNNLSPIILDLFNPISNCLIIGATGFGKSFFSMMLLTRLRLNQTKVFIVTPIKGHEYKKICEELGGSFIELGPGSKDGVNILEVKPVYKVEMFDENETIVRKTSYLSEKIEELTAFFNLISGGLSRECRDLLSPFLIEFYSDFGITEDNNSIYKEGNPEKGFKRMPILSDLKEALEEQGEKSLRDLATRLLKFTDGNLKSFNHPTNVDLDSPFCVIDLSRAIEYEDTRGLVNFIVQNFIWSRIRSDRKQRKVILYEEIWKFLDNQETARTIREIFKTIRAYFGVAIAVTQNLGDLTDNSFHVSDGILNNIFTQFIFHSSADEAEKLTERFKLGSEDYNFITGSDKGECLIVSPREHFEAKIIATSREEILYETDGNKL